VTTDPDALLTAPSSRLTTGLGHPPRTGRPLKLTDAEPLTLAVAQALPGIRSETRWLRLYERPQRPHGRRRTATTATGQAPLLAPVSRETTPYPSPERRSDESSPCRHNAQHPTSPRHDGRAVAVRRGLALDEDEEEPSGHRPPAPRQRYERQRVPRFHVKHQLRLLPAAIGAPRVARRSGHRHASALLAPEAKPGGPLSAAKADDATVASKGTGAAPPSSRSRHCVPSQEPTASNQAETAFAGSPGNGCRLRPAEDRVQGPGSAPSTARWPTCADVHKGPTGSRALTAPAPDAMFHVKPLPRWGARRSPTVESLGRADVCGVPPSTRPSRVRRVRRTAQALQTGPRRLGPTSLRGGLPTRRRMPAIRVRQQTLTPPSRRAVPQTGPAAPRVGQRHPRRTA